MEHDLILGRSVLQELSKALEQKVKLPARDIAAIITFLGDEAPQLSNRQIPQTLLSIETMQLFSETQWQGMRGICPRPNRR